MTRNERRARIIAQKNDIKQTPGMSVSLLPPSYERCKHEAATYIAKHIRNKRIAIELNGRCRYVHSKWLNAAAEWRRLAMKVKSS